MLICCFGAAFGSELIIEPIEDGLVVDAEDLTLDESVTFKHEDWGPIDEAIVPYEVDLSKVGEDIPLNMPSIYTVEINDLRPLPPWYFGRYYASCFLLIVCYMLVF